MKRSSIAVGLLMCMAAPVRPEEGHGPAITKQLERLRVEYAEVLALEGAPKEEILAIARLLRAKPEMAIDRTKESGEYCLKSGLGTMIHYASSPERTREDIVYEFAAAPLVEAGLDLEKLARLPGLGKMEPGRWYYLPEGQVDPHHQHTMPGPTLLISIDVR
jgi:hypothetical protein